MRWVDYTVSVTEEHIKHGVRNYSSKCPVARALLDLEINGKQPTHASASHTHATVQVDHNLLGSPLPQEASDWIRAFDKGEDMEPIEFEISLWVDEDEDEPAGEM